MQQDPAAAEMRAAVGAQLEKERERADKAFRKVWDESKRVIHESPGELPEEIADSPSNIGARYKLHSADELTPSSGRRWSILMARRL